MIRSYAVALTFLEIRVILGVFGLDQPLDWHILETVVWSCVASSVLIGDIANQFYEGRSATAPSRRKSGGQPGLQQVLPSPAHKPIEGQSDQHGSRAFASRQDGGGDHGYRPFSSVQIVPR